MTDFEVDSPNIDETALTNEDPTSLAIRLATEKAHKIAPQWDNALIIGSDQVALLQHKDNALVEILGKPGDFETAQQQLRKCSGQSIIYPLDNGLLLPRFSFTPINEHKNIDQ